MCNEGAAGCSSHNSAITTLEKRCLNSAFDFFELFTQGRFSEAQALCSLGHVALFMKGNDDFHIADSELPIGHKGRTSARGYSKALSNQAGRSDHAQFLAPGKNGQSGFGLYIPRASISY
jgi:hypothetical protein